MNPSAARFLLTRTAALDLRRVHARSVRVWGEEVADRYLNDLYAAMRQAAVTPEAGRLRQNRAAPFRMILAREHFVVYELLPRGIVVLTVQHQARDIEALLAEFAPTFFAAVEQLRRE